MKKNVDGVEYEMAPEEEDAFLASLAPPPPTVEQYQAAIQSLVNETARSQKFNDGVTLASYAASTIAPWAAQAAAFISWRDKVWQYSYSEMAKVRAGERETPSVDAFLLELPEIVWP